MEKELLSLRVDDIPLIYAEIQSLKIGELIDRHFVAHGNWEGASAGSITELWMCYILSEGDHRLSTVEQWAEDRIELLRVLSGTVELSSYDFSDDKLGLLLDYFGADELWGLIDLGISDCLLSVYRVGEEELPVFRLDAAPMQSYGKVQEGGLLQYGYNKHHPNIGQLKIKLCTLDNGINYFASPICHLTVPGNVSDDELYLPIIKENKKHLAQNSSYSRGNLYVGDKKFGSLANRTYVESEKDYYMMPLSLVQLKLSQRKQAIEQRSESTYEKVYKEVKKGGIVEQFLVAQGFEEVVEMEGIIAGVSHKWIERRLYVRSEKYVKSQTKSLENRLEKSQSSIMGLGERKQGKKVLSTKQEYEEAIAKILKDNRVEGLLDYEILKHQSIKKIRKHKDKPAREELISTFEVKASLKESAIEAYKKTLGWQVYATNAPQAIMPFEKCVWKYRYQSNIESRFDDLRNKVAGLVPIFLQKDIRIKGLVNILLSALKICSNIEYKATKSLKDKEEDLTNIFEGNPKRGTSRPSSKRLFSAFKGISIALVFVAKSLDFALMTPLQQTQLDILDLLGINKDIYLQLARKLEFQFST